MIQLRHLAYFLLPPAMLSLVIGIITGWQRLGIRTTEMLPHEHHGALMTGCFLGGLVMLERAVSLGKRWSYAGSLLCAISLILFLIKLPVPAIAGIILASLIYLFMLIYQHFKEPDTSQLVAILGAFCLFTGNTLLLIHNLYPLAVNWWMGFLLFTILGERLNLDRTTHKHKRIHQLLAFLVFAGLLLPFHLSGATVLGGSLVLTGTWLMFSLKFSDPRTPQKKFMMLASVMAFFWLITTGVLMLSGAMFYDAQLHSFFVGFVFSMIFAHAPLMLPRVFKFEADLFHPVVYILLLALQAGLFVRVYGSVLENEHLTRWGGFSNGIIILIFLLTMAGITYRKTQKSIVQNDRY